MAPDDRNELVALVVVGERAAYLRAGMPRFGSSSAILAEVSTTGANEHPRWAVPSAATTLAPLVAAGLPIARTWDLAEVHRLLAGGWAADPATVTAYLDGLPEHGIVRDHGDDLFAAAAAPAHDPAPDEPTGPDGQLRAEAFEPRWADRDERLVALVTLVQRLARAQRERIAALGPRAVATAHSESAAAVLCLELERDGLPLDRPAAEVIIGRAAGARPADERDAARIRAARDAQVLRHTPGRSADLRNPAQVRELLAAAGVTVANTRKWELEPYRATHPVVAALLDWRKDERIATTYGYRWLDEQVGPDGRLRGAWTACDGAAGRMTAGAGLHNLPSVLRAAVRAEPGQVFVRADLGQIEPRVLAAVSGDPAFAAASLADDLYAPVAAKLRVERAVAKVAVLAAMYGQRSGAAGAALADLQRAYPVAMRLLDEAYAAGLAARPLRTAGGRLIALDRSVVVPDGAPAATRAALDAARGRYARNAIIQGAAAELFKAWAATVRYAVRPLGGQIVLCLHDELLVQVPAEAADAGMAAVTQALADAARRWTGGAPVRFVADLSVVSGWDQAKG